VAPGDFRNVYFAGDNLRASVEHAERLRPDVPKGMTMPELALALHPRESRRRHVIPGMRKRAHVEANIAASDGRRLDATLVKRLRAHRWDRGALKNPA
jgi:aryl-alcohol dehydrogenase-like predicted oxidoreductase